MVTDLDHDDLSAAFWELTDDQITVLRPRGEVRPIEAGQRLFQQGDLACDFLGSNRRQRPYCRDHRRRPWLAKSPDPRNRAILIHPR